MKMSWKNQIQNHRKEVIKIRAVINEMETKRTMQRINETNIWIFGRINKITNSAKLTRKKKTK
jgi:hypothetical protein